MLKKEQLVKTGQETLEDGVTQSLCFLYRETLKENKQEMNAVIQKAIEEIQDIMKGDLVLSNASEDALKEFCLLRGFRRLNKTQKELFIRAVDRMLMDS